MKCVLILEDEPFIALDLAFACEDAGVKSVTAASCEQANEAMERNAIDGAILDVNLGKGETCERVARELKDRGVPFVLNTGDLNRAGEFVRDMNAPIIGKPSSASSVIARLLALGEGLSARA